jgi:hypothetical protein
MEHGGDVGVVDPGLDKDKHDDVLHDDGVGCIQQ